jgi:hypothetical protein
MKNTSAFALAAVAVALTLGVEEYRISGLQKQVPSEVTVHAKITGATSPTTTNIGPEAHGPTKVLAERPAPKKDSDDDESFNKSIRKMWDNPAGKSMMNQGAKVAVTMMYQDYIDTLNLSKEEADYFKNILTDEIASQQALGMKALGADKEEMAKIGTEITDAQKKTQEDIKKFLNSDEDYKKFNDYKERLPEHQQIDSIRSAFSSAGSPLDKDSEAKLVEAMHEARTTSDVPNLSGGDAMKSLADGNLVENYEKGWEKQQAVLQQKAATFLNPAQLTALQDQQKQMKDMQVMGLKMAEKMMKDKAGK